MDSLSTQQSISTQMSKNIPEPKVSPQKNLQYVPTNINEGCEWCQKQTDGGQCEKGIGPYFAAMKFVFVQQ
jgi:hypothetical protein